MYNLYDYYELDIDLILRQHYSYLDDVFVNRIQEAILE